MRNIVMAGTILVASVMFGAYSDVASAKAASSTTETASAESNAPAAKGKSRAKVKKHITHAKKSPATKPRKSRKIHAAALDSGTGPLRLESSAAMVFDESEAKPLYAKNPTSTQSIASITKLMTAMVVLDGNLPMDEKVTVENEDVDTLRRSSSRLAVGTTLSREEMLRLALMSSENRAAAALARTYPGGLPAFVAAMNRKAVSLGMAHTRFVDSTGLHSENVSTAEDLVKMVKAGYGYEAIREYTTTAAYDVPVGNSRRNLEFKNTNALVRSKSKEWDIGLSKTGFINEAGRCLVMHVNIASKPLIIVLLDSWGKYTRIGDANRIKKWVENSRNGSVARMLQASNGV